MLWWTLAAIMAGVVIGLGGGGVISLCAGCLLASIIAMGQLIAGDWLAAVMSWAGWMVAFVVVSAVTDGLSRVQVDVDDEGE